MATDNRSLKKREYRYFIYSSSQHQVRQETDSLLGKVFIPGEVLVGGTWKRFTHILTTPDSVYSDAVIVAKGYLDEIKYKNCSSRWRAEER